jgi:hypothetical protein
VQLGLDDVRELLRFRDRRRRFFACNGGGRRERRSFLWSFSRFTQGAEMFPNLVGKFVVKRAGMRLFPHPKFGKKLQDKVTLDLQFTRQDVDSYVAHSVFLFTLPCFPPVSRRTG